MQNSPAHSIQVVSDRQAINELSFQKSKEQVCALIDANLLDKAFSVQEAAKLVIEENFGNKLKNGADVFIKFYRF